MKLIDTKADEISYSLRGAWHFIQDTVCFIVCVLTINQVPETLRNPASNLFNYITGVVFIVLLFKFFRNDEYKNAVKKVGLYGIKYRLFYVVYYSFITFICASNGKIFGYIFAGIWMLSGGAYLLIADKIAKEENDAKEEIAEKICTEKMKSSNDACPYCRSANVNEESTELEIKSRIVNFLCKDCKRTWKEEYELKDIHLLKKEVPADKNILEGLF